MAEREKFFSSKILILWEEKKRQNKAKVTQKVSDTKVDKKTKVYEGRKKKRN